ncbi:EAL domain-containing protein [Lichenihabitans sp. Uapishka_5]|uniref:putative bifunctional diguanylate cyclase/phosphodiesterase n=1 Tax=Lichenihabitans sp. Uapishka_5 TaxID=3037302 RepID=UPI0029E81E26|nr:EAL domain-containing protein [Lichenihabitans sp. Uapishka_5]MDX7950270.1 EAL domain-containing protein [Lichenihabitans sp. Uapishka_5]
MPTFEHRSTDLGIRPASAWSDFNRLHGASGASRLIAAFCDDLDEGVMLIDQDAMVVLCSERARRLLDLPAERSVVGSSLWHLLAGFGPDWRRDRSLSAARCIALLRHGGSVAIGIPGAVDDVICRVRIFPGIGWAFQIAGRPDSCIRRDDAVRRDPTTGLPDRATFLLALEQASGAAGHAVLSLTIERFRAVNDTLGRALGDAIMRVVAARLRTTLRCGDAVSRLDGSGFAILQRNVAEAADAERLAARIVDLVGRPIVLDGHLISISASVGIALATEPGCDPVLLLKRAELALSAAKRHPARKLLVFSPGMEQSDQARRTLEIDLRRALVLGQFELEYQPQMDLDSGRLVGCEALIRWRHPTRGTVGPNEFIPLAEELGLIVPIGAWVLRVACQNAAGWPGNVGVAVNLSPAQFDSPGLVDAVQAALAASCLDPRRLELEITEGLLLRESASSFATLDALRKLGVSIAIDDFGTGYASLSVLRAFPFDRIKIDRSFVSGNAADEKSKAIVRAIVELGSSLGMSTVAEGVETAEQMQSIRAGGCTMIQGYLIGRPMPAHAVAVLLAEGADGRAVAPEHGEA